MIEVHVSKNGEPIAHIEIKNETSQIVQELHGATHEYADYTVKYAVERGSAVGLHTRWIYAFPRKEFNALALVRQALNTLDEKELRLERNFDPDAPEATVSSDLARRLNRPMREIQARFSRLYRDRPSVRGGQSKQSSGD